MCYERFKISALENHFLDHALLLTSYRYSSEKIKSNTELMDISFPLFLINSTSCDNAHQYVIGVVTDWSEGGIKMRVRR